MGCALPSLRFLTFFQLEVKCWSLSGHFCKIKLLWEPLKWSETVPKGSDTVNLNLTLVL